jgi:uroporphyrinogen III methyltransferase/synthase
MIAFKKESLTGKRILVPPARPEVNPLLRMLKREGAEVVEFPAISVAPPKDYEPMDKAIRKLKIFAWIIFSGSNCVVNFFERLRMLGLSGVSIVNVRIGAIGHGAHSALKKEGINNIYVPKMHTAEGVIEGLGDIRGLHFLLVRVEGGSRSLPEKLKDLGAKVVEVDGYRMAVHADPDEAEKIFGQKLDILALANPTSVRFLVNAVSELGIDLRVRLKGVLVAAVGPATAEAAGRLGLTPDIVSKGHIADLVKPLIDLEGFR